MPVRLPIAIGLVLASAVTSAQPTPPKRPAELSQPAPKENFKPEPQRELKPEPKVESKIEVKPEAKPEVPPKPQPDAMPAPAVTAAPAPNVQPGCFEALAARHGAGVKREVPKEGARGGSCQVVEPVRVATLTLRAAEGNKVLALDPPALLSCEMATAAASWLETSVQPLARGYFGRDLEKLRVGGGHECRNRNRAASGRLSEHATGRALDIFAFVPEGGAPAVVEKPGGLTASRFIDAVRQSACGAFMTALGPGSDAAHANHLHVDIQQRRSGASRYCQ